MNRKLRERIAAYAWANWHRPVWKARWVALNYGAGLVVLNRIK